MDSLQLVKGAAHAKHISLPTPKLKFCARQEGLLTGGTGVLVFFYGGYRKVFRAQRGHRPRKSFWEVPEKNTRFIVQPGSKTLALHKICVLGWGGKYYPLTAEVTCHTR